MLEQQGLTYVWVAFIVASLLSEASIRWHNYSKGDCDKNCEHAIGCRPTRLLSRLGASSRAIFVISQLSWHCWVDGALGRMKQIFDGQGISLCMCGMILSASA